MREKISKNKLSFSKFEQKTFGRDMILKNFQHFMTRQYSPRIPKKNLTTASKNAVRPQLVSDFKVLEMANSVATPPITEIQCGKAVRGFKRLKLEYFHTMLPISVFQGACG